MSSLLIPEQYWPIIITNVDEQDYQNLKVYHYSPPHQSTEVKPVLPEEKPYAPYSPDSDIWEFKVKFADYVQSHLPEAIKDYEFQFCLDHDATFDQEINDLYGKEWGIIGFGNIGKQVCKLAHSFGANISYHSTSGNNTQAQIPHKSLDSLLSTSDIISIHAPLNSHTHNLITKRQLQKLKKGAILLNLGRGGIVNERDLAEQLHQQDFYFGTDVLEKEPMIENHPLLDSNIAHKIIITPHIAWAYKDTKERLLQLVAKNIESFIQSCHT